MENIEMAKANLTHAAKLAGISRSTIMRHLKEGKITKEIDRDGKPCIDLSEIERVYGPIQNHETEITVPVNSRETSEKGFEDRGLDREVEALRAERLKTLERQLDEIRSERDDWKKEAEDWKKQAQHLLTDQRSEIPIPVSRQNRSGFFRWFRS